MDEGADLRSPKRGRAVFLRLQAVVAVIPEAAGRKALQPRGTDPDVSAVEGFHRTRTEVGAPQLGVVQELFHAPRLIGRKPGCRRPCFRTGAGTPRRDREGQRALPGGEPVCVFSCTLRAEGKDPFGLVPDHGGNLDLALHSGVGTAQDQLVLRQRERVPDHGVFPPELRLSPADHQFVFRKLVELGGVKDSSVGTGAGQTVVAAAKHNQTAYIPPPHPVKITGGNPVQRNGNEADVILGQHRVQGIPKSGEVHGGIAQHRRDLAQGLQAKAPELAVFRTQLQVSLLFQTLHTLFQPLGRMCLPQEGGKRFGVFGGRRRGGGALFQVQERLRDISARTVDALYALSGLIVPRLSVSVRMLMPRFRALPRAAFQLPFIKITAELVTVLLIQSAEPAAQIRGYVLRIPAGQEDVISGLDPERKRSFRHLIPSCDEKRNLKSAEAVFQNPAIVLKPAHRDSDVAPAAALFPHRVQNLGRAGLTLIARIVRLQQPDAPVGRLRRGGGIVEQMVCKIRERTFPFPKVDRFFPDFRSGGFRCFAQRLQRQARRQKEFFVVLFRRRKADGQTLPAPQQGAEHFQLQTGKIDEPVDVDPVKLGKSELLQLSGKKAESFFRCRPGTFRHRVIGIQNQGKLLQFSAKFSVQLLRQRPKRAGVGRGGPDGFRFPQKQLLQVDVLRRSAEQTQRRLKFFQRGRHAEQPPGLVQTHFRASAVLSHAPTGKAAEAHHLGKERKPVAAGLTELPLRFMAVLLRNKEQRALRPFSYRLPDFPDDIRGFAAADFSCDQSQTHTQFPVFCSSAGNTGSCFLYSIIPKRPGQAAV